MNKKGNSDFEKVIGIIFFFIIIGIFFAEGIFSAIFSSFSEALGSFGFLLGGLLILMIIVGLLQKILEK